MTLTHDTTICIFDKDIDIEIVYWMDPDETVIHGFNWDKKMYNDAENEQINAFLHTDKQAIKFYHEIKNA